MTNKRSYEKEIIDLGPAYYSEDEYLQCLKILFKINRYLGIVKDTKKQLHSMKKSSSLLDVGCGGGLFVKELATTFPNWHFTGLDYSKAAIAYANQNLQATQLDNVLFQQKNAFDLINENNQYDIVMTTLFCHHLEDQALIDFLKLLKQITKTKIIIHDLHRHILAQYGYRVLSSLLTRNRLIRHDGLISIRRGFVYSEWQQALSAAGFTNYTIQWRWPFRWMVSVWKT